MYESEERPEGKARAAFGKALHTFGWLKSKAKPGASKSRAPPSYDEWLLAEIPDGSPRTSTDLPAAKVDPEILESIEGMQASLAELRQLSTTAKSYTGGHLHKQSPLDSYKPSAASPSLTSLCKQQDLIGRTKSEFMAREKWHQQRRQQLQLQQQLSQQHAKSLLLPSLPNSSPSHPSAQPVSSNPAKALPHGRLQGILAHQGHQSNNISAHLPSPSASSLMPDPSQADTFLLPTEHSKNAQQQHQQDLQQQRQQQQQPADRPAGHNTGKASPSVYSRLRVQTECAPSRSPFSSSPASTKPQVFSASAMSQPLSGMLSNTRPYLHEGSLSTPQASVDLQSSMAAPFRLTDSNLSQLWKAPLVRLSSDQPNHVTSPKLQSSGMLGARELASQLQQDVSPGLLLGSHKKLEPFNEQRVEAVGSDQQGEVSRAEGRFLLATQSSMRRSEKPLGRTDSIKKRRTGHRVSHAGRSKHRHAKGKGKRQSESRALRGRSSSRHLNIGVGQSSSKHSSRSGRTYKSRSNIPSCAQVHLGSLISMSSSGNLRHSCSCSSLQRSSSQEVWEDPASESESDSIAKSMAYSLVPTCSPLPTGTGQGLTDDEMRACSRSRVHQLASDNVSSSSSSSGSPAGALRSSNLHPSPLNQLPPRPTHLARSATTDTCSLGDSAASAAVVGSKAVGDCAPQGAGGDTGEDADLRALLGSRQPPAPSRSTPRKHAPTKTSSTSALGTKNRQTCFNLPQMSPRHFSKPSTSQASKPDLGPSPHALSISSPNSTSGSPKTPSPLFSLSSGPVGFNQNGFRAKGDGTGALNKQKGTLQQYLAGCRHDVTRMEPDTYLKKLDVENKGRSSMGRFAGCNKANTKHEKSLPELHTTVERSFLRQSEAPEAGAAESTAGSTLAAMLAQVDEEEQDLQQRQARLRAAAQSLEPGKGFELRSKWRGAL